jgi:16S rRNA (guanine527-N7)-methyltransferase
VGLRRGDIVPVTPYEGSRNRHLHLYLKVRRTPERFPRRPGVAAKRPLA